MTNPRICNIDINVWSLWPIYPATPSRKRILLQFQVWARTYQTMPWHDAWAFFYYDWPSHVESMRELYRSCNSRPILSFDRSLLIHEGDFYCDAFIYRKVERLLLPLLLSPDARMSCIPTVNGAFISVFKLWFILYWIIWSFGISPRVLLKTGGRTKVCIRSL